MKLANIESIDIDKLLYFRNDSTKNTMEISDRGKIKALEMVNDSKTKNRLPSRKTVGNV